MLEVNEIMGFLKNLKVSKVSFVRRGANKRKFLLLKSAEDITNSDQMHKEELMQELVKTKVIEILNKEQDPVKVVSLLKADSEIVNLKLSDEDFVEVTNSVEFFKALIPTEKSDDEKKAAEEKAKLEKEAAAAAKKAAAASNGDDDLTMSDVVKQLAEMTSAVKKSNEQNQTLSEKLEKQEEEIARRDILKWLTINCPYLPADVQKTADEILAVQKVSVSAAQTMKDGFQRASAALANSDAFDQIGNGQDGQIGPKIPGSAFLQEIQKELKEVKKSGETVDEPAIIRGIVNGGGRNNYLAYRNQVIQRAKLSGIDPEILSNLAG